jgi:hypothetical protein
MRTIDENAGKQGNFHRVVSTQADSLKKEGVIEDG